MQHLHFPESNLGMSLSVLARLKRCVTATTLGSTLGQQHIKTRTTYLRTSLQKKVKVYLQRIH